jgi:hypothetical protein
MAAGPRLLSAAVLVACVSAGVSACGSSRPQAAPATSSSARPDASTGSTAPSEAPSSPATSPTPQLVASATSASPATSPAEPPGAPEPLVVGQTGTRSQVPWGQVGAGWFVLTTLTSPTSGTETLWLISPQGGRYRIVSWPATQQPTNADIGYSSPLAWSGDATRVLMGDLGGSGKHEIDLRSGAIRSVGVDTVGYTAPSGLQFVAVHYDATLNEKTLERVNAAGAVQFVLEAAQHTLDRWLYSPDGTTVFAGTTIGLNEISNGTGRVETLIVQKDSHTCSPLKWWSQGVILVTCSNDNGNRLWLVPTDGSSPRQITATPGSGGVSPGLGEIGAVSWNSQIYAQGLRGCGVVGIDEVAADTSIRAVTVPGSKGNDVLVGAAPAGLAVLSTGGCEEGGWFGFYNPVSGAVATIVGADSPDGSAQQGLAFGSMSWLTS